MHANGSGHVHGGREGRMSFEWDDLATHAELHEQLNRQLDGEEVLPSSPFSHPSAQLDEEARAYFRAKVDRL